MHHSVENLPGWRGDIERFMALSFIQNFLIILIVINAIILGLETNHEIMAEFGTELLALDHVILWIFIAELALLIASRRTVVGALLSSLPGLGSVFSLILIIFYVSAVIATNMFGVDFPERFGSLSNSLYTLFQVMTLEGWSEEIARPVMVIFPSAWVFFVLFILTATFIVVNLFVAVIVDSINSVRAAASPDPHGVIEEEIRHLNSEISELKSLINDIHKKINN
jgi:voltage-gated sodium channel